MTALEQTRIEPVRKSVTVPCGRQAAFDTFTRKISDWWPRDAHSVSAMNGGVAQKVVLEPRKGGRLYEVSADGEEIEWGSIKRFEDGKRLTLLWHIQKPASQATEVDVTFTDTANGGTEVVLVHSNWEVSGEGAESLRDGYNTGWVRVFEECFVGACGAG